MAGWLLAAVAGAGAAPSVVDWRLEWGRPWRVSGDFAKGKDMSAAATLGGGEAVLASDETRAVQRVVLDGGARVMTVMESLPLLPGKGAEIDLEGAAASAKERAYFLVGSLALTRQGDAFEPERGYVFRLPVDGAGRPQPKAVAKVDLRGVMAADPVLSRFVNEPADANGLDIEGLAERDGRLFFGLRAPVQEGEATVVEVETQALFAGRGGLRHHRLALGQGRGIRDLVALEGEAGFLVLVGSSGGTEGGRSATGDKYELWHWEGPEGAVKRLGGLGPVAGEPDAKAEGLLVLNHSEAGLEGLIIHDGPKNGAPHEFRLLPPTAP